MLMRFLAMLAVLAGIALLLPVHAQWQTNPSAPEPRDVPGRFDYYTLVLSWSPTHCATSGRRKDDAQCARNDGRRYGFVLHGLWPQYEQGYPARCHTRWRPFVPEEVIASVGDIMPNRGLVIHEYREHGTCSGLRPAGYYALARQLFARINIPKRYRNPMETQVVPPAEVLADFLQANPGLRPNTIAIGCDGPANRLRDVRICMTKEGNPRSCGQNEWRGAACRAGVTHVPPVRSRQWDYAKDQPLPLKRPPAETNTRTFEMPR